MGTSRVITYPWLLTWHLKALNRFGNGASGDGEGGCAPGSPGNTAGLSSAGAHQSVKHERARREQWGLSRSGAHMSADGD
jgi:hypothetical protein